MRSKIENELFIISALEHEDAIVYNEIIPILISLLSESDSNIVKKLDKYIIDSYILVKGISTLEETIGVNENILLIKDNSLYLYNYLMIFKC